MTRRVGFIGSALILLLLPLSACKRESSPTTRELSPSATPATIEQKRAEGDAILKRMSDRMRSAPALSFSTTETIDRVKRNDEKVHVNLERDVIVRRPDRLWFKTRGDRELEAFYDGSNVTLVSHKDKVWGQFKAAPTLDETADIITARYDIPLPIADLLTFNPHDALLDEQTTGGWDRRETLNGIEYDVMAYQHPNVEFTIWIPRTGDPLPAKLQITYKARRGQPSTTVEFKNWNLSPQVSEAIFAQNVPDDYEGIPIIQRASAVVPAEESGTPTAPTP